MPFPHSMKKRFSSLISALSHPLPQTPSLHKNCDNGTSGCATAGKGTTIFLFLVEAEQSTEGTHQSLDGPNHQSPIASVQRTLSTLAGHSAVPCGTNRVTRTNVRQSRDSNRSTTNAESMRTDFCVLEGDLSHLTVNER